VADQETDRRRGSRTVRSNVPAGFAGPDVVSEIAPDGWEHSPQLACFHRSPERVLEERLLIHRNLEQLRRVWKCRDGASSEVSYPAPTLDELRREYSSQPVRQDEEVTEVMGLCLWDIFSDNHEVITADGWLVNIGSFRRADAFLNEHLTRQRHDSRHSRYLRFYMATIWISGRADLTPVYAMIFRRLSALWRRLCLSLPGVRAPGVRGAPRSGTVGDQLLRF